MYKMYNKFVSILSVGFTNNYSRGSLESREKFLDLAKKLSEEALRIVEIFYNYTFKEPVNIRITDRSGIDLVSSHKSARWCIGKSSSQGIYLLDPRLYKNKAAEYGFNAETDHIYSEKDWSRLIKHELGHTALKRLCGLRYKDIEIFTWFDEGVQEYLSGAAINSKAQLDFTVIVSKNVVGYHEKCAEIIYKLVEKVGEQKFKDNLANMLGALHEVHINNESSPEEAIRERLRSTFENSFKKYYGEIPNVEGLQKLL